MANKLLRFGKYLAKNHQNLILRQSIQSSRLLSSNAVYSPQTLQTELKNGVRVATEDIGSATSTVSVWIECGSRYETEDNNGISNLVLHSILGNKLESQLNTFGAVLNARTDRESTTLSIRCLSNDISKAIEILGNLISNPKLDENVISSEKQKILREMSELDTNYESVALNYLHAMAFMKTSLGLPSIGKSETIESLNRNDLINYINTHFKGPRIVVSAAGHLDHNNVVQSVERHFGQISKNYDLTEIPILTKARYTGSDIRIRDDSMPVAHIALAVEGAGYDNPDHIPLLLVSNLNNVWNRSFGGAFNVSTNLGRLSATDDSSLAFRSFNLNYKDSGLFGIYFVCERLKEEEFVKDVTKEWRSFCTDLTDNQLNRGKNITLLNWMKDNEGSYRVANNIGQQIINYGKRLSLDELRTTIESINADKVRDVCNEYIWDRCPVVSAIGPIEQLEDYENLRSLFY